MLKATLAAELPQILPLEPFSNDKWRGVFDSLSHTGEPSGCPYKAAFLHSDAGCPEPVCDSESAQEEKRTFVMLPNDIFDPMWIYLELEGNAPDHSVEVMKGEDSLR